MQLISTKIERSNDFDTLHGEAVFIQAVAEVKIGDTVQTIRSGGLSTDAAGDAQYLAEIEAEERAALDGLLAEIGVTGTLPELIERLKADLAFHQDEAERITRESLDIDTAPEGAYSIEDDTAESHHTGRVEALQQVLLLLQGHEVKLYSETEDASKAGASGELAEETS